MRNGLPRLIDAYPKRAWFNLMHTQTRLTIENHLEASFESLCSVTGGDINQAFKAELSDGRTVLR